MMLVVTDADESTEGFNLPPPPPRWQPLPGTQVYLPKVTSLRPLAKAVGISLYKPVFFSLASKCYEHLFAHAEVSKGGSGELERSNGTGLH